MALLAACLALPLRVSPAAEPEGLNPFGAARTERDDAVPGYVELSNGKVLAGSVYMTRDKRVKLDDEKLNRQRQREIPWQRIEEIECEVKWEKLEKEWRFKELTSDEKFFTGRSYPAREYVHTLTLSGGRKLRGQISEIVYVQPFLDSAEGAAQDRPRPDPMRFMLYKRQKGEPGTTLKALVYVKRVKMGDEAYKEGKAKAARPKSDER
jgi:hypothetical protein